MPSPLQTSADVGRVAAALRGLLSELESVPVRASCLAIAWDNFRNAFGECPTPEGVSVDSNQLPDMNGLTVLIGRSSAISDEARDALRDAIDAVEASGNSALIFRDQIGEPDPTPEAIRRHRHDQLARGADDGPIRDAKKAIRSALTLLPAATQQSARTPLPDGIDENADPFADLRNFARSELKGQERAVIEALCAAKGELPIADLAVLDAVGWDDENEGYGNLRKRLNPKLKRMNWRLSRSNNAGKLAPISGVEKRFN